MPRKKREPLIITLDTETIGLDGPLKRIAIYDGQEVTYGYTFKDVVKRIDWYYDMGFLPHIYIHNADFDLRKIPEIFERGNILWNTTRKIGMKYARVTCVKYTIHDSFKILPLSLAKLSKDFDLEHGKVDLWEEVQKAYPGQYENHVDFLNRCDPDDPIYLKYLGFDVIALYELIQKLMEVSGIPLEDFVKILSTASMSKYLFKNGHKGRTFTVEGRGKTGYELLTSNKAWSSAKKMKYTDISYLDCEAKIRESYAGGRTELFTPYCFPKEDGSPAAYYNDVNSEYPFVMQNELPIGYPEYENDKRLTRHNWEKWCEFGEGLGFIKAEVYIPPQKIPPLPVKLGKLAFVTGHVRGSWTFTELKYAVDNCGVIVENIEETIWFKKTAPIFRDFVLYFYEMKTDGKRSGNAALTALAKLILNCAYGWTATRRDDKTALRDISLLDKWKDNDRFIYSNDEMGYIEIFDNVLTDTIQVQVAAYITSYARLVLLDAMRKQAEVGEIYYCDTDSIVCEKPMPPEMTHAYDLGKWDVEHIIYSAIFVQPKVYHLVTEKGKETVKFKGITKAKQAELTLKDYQDLAGKIARHEYGKIMIEEGRQSLPSLSVAQKNHRDPNTFNVIDKHINLGLKQKRDIDFAANRSTSWHMESLEQFDSFTFDTFDNPPEGPNLFGG